MDEWYKDWFNTREYLNVYRHRNEEDAKKLVDLILKNVFLPGNAKVLDLACGPGRHSILFAEQGYRVTAVDLSENLLAIAKKIAVGSGFKINFFKCDLRNFSVSAKFDLVVNLFTSFGYFEDDLENFKLFEVSFDLLENGGYFVLDYLNKYYIEKNLIPESVDEQEGGIIVQKRCIKGNRVIKNISLFSNGQEKRYHESVRMYGKDELIKNIENRGFEIKSIFGDFEGHCFDPEKSSRIIIIARK